MSTLFVMFSIFDRKKIKTVLQLYHSNYIQTHLMTLGYGTAQNEILSYLGMERTEKVVITSFITAETWKRICPILQKNWR